MSDNRAEQTALTDLLQSLASATVLVGHRFIETGDDDALFPTERAGFGNASTSVRRQGGAARIVARSLLARFGRDGAEIGRASSRAPIWPPGITGSLAHDNEVAVAAVARTTAIRSIGIDIEPAWPLPAGIADRIATASEQRRYGTAILSSRRLFVVKEAVYKAVHPIDGTFLDFGDIEVDLDASTARTSGGRSIDFALVCGSHVVALARVRH